MSIYDFCLSMFLPISSSLSLHTPSLDLCLYLSTYLFSETLRGFNLPNLSIYYSHDSPTEKEVAVGRRRWMHGPEKSSVLGIGLPLKTDVPMSIAPS